MPLGLVLRLGRGTHDSPKFTFFVNTLSDQHTATPLLTMGIAWLLSCRAEVLRDRAARAGSPRRDRLGADLPLVREGARTDATRGSRGGTARVSCIVYLPANRSTCNASRPVLLAPLLSLSRRRDGRDPARCVAGVSTVVVNPRHEAPRPFAFPPKARLLFPGEGARRGGRLHALSPAMFSNTQFS